MNDRASILLWSAGSGLLLGLFIDALLIGVWVVTTAIVPGLAARLSHRWVMIAAAVGLAVIPMIGAVLGYLEGRMKLS